MNRRSITTVVALAASGAMAVAATPSSSAVPAQSGAGTLTPTQELAWAHGLQVTAKSTKQTGPNPWLAEVSDPTVVDYSYWKGRMATAGKARAKSASLASAQKAAGVTAKPVLVHDEQEPVGDFGTNDTAADAEPISGFGTGTGQNPRLRILGSMPDLSEAAEALPPSAEDNGSIDLAADTGIEGLGAVTTSGTLGDGPHGTTGDATGDFDFYALSADAGTTVKVSTIGSTAGTDTIAVLYDAEGEIVAANDDAFFGTLASELSFDVPAAGTYYAMVVGYSSDPLPADPFDSGSGAGQGDVGAYVLALSAQEVDRDFYAVGLKKGDVIGATVTGDVTGLAIQTPAGEERVVADGVDASSLYPPTSPLPGGGNTTLAYVAESDGQYTIEALPTDGSYDITLNAFRPGTETDRSAKVQTVFLDFDGATVNTGTWGGPGVRTLSPFGTFLAKWGIPRSQEQAVIKAVTAEVTENIKADLRKSGNKNVQVNIVNSSNSPDVYGQTNVARVIVGGTIDQSGIPTIGIAQYIDPGNYGHEDDALVLLDVLSDPDQGDTLQQSGNGSSLNTYLEASSDRAAFVAQALGNVIAHEVGHTIGNYHTDNANEVRNLMDSGGGGFGDNLYAVGPDRIGGTADDADRDFVTDGYSPAEGFSGLENTFNVSAWAYVKPLR